MDGALSNLGWWKMSLLLAGGLEPEELLRSLPTQTGLWFYGWGFEQPRLVEDVPAPGRGVGTR